jgi:molecular chaperone GrpE
MPLDPFACFSYILSIIKKLLEKMKDFEKQPRDIDITVPEDVQAGLCENGVCGVRKAPDGQAAEASQNDADGAADDAACAESPCDPAQKIAELEEKVAGLNDQFLRKAADFENFRKRANQEKITAIEFANQSLLLDLVPILDDFERAIRAAESVRAPATEDGAVDPKAAFETLLTGISMTESRLYSILENKWGLKRYTSTGEAFDPEKHEALMVEKSPEAESPVVGEEFAKGYTLKDRVIRAAKVKVIQPEE